MNMMNRMQYYPEVWEMESRQETASEWRDRYMTSLIENALDALNTLICTSLCERTEELICEYGTPVNDPQVVMLIQPDFTTDVATADECEELLDELGDYSAVESVFEDTLLLRYDESDVVTLGGVRYLVGLGVIFEIDEYGNECSIDRSTIETVMDFMEKNHTKITVDGQSFDAFRLE